MSTGPRPGVLTPRQPAWAISAAVVCAVATVAYAAIAWNAAWRPGRTGGLVAGTAAAVLFVNAALYPARRRLLARPLRTAQQWLQLHIYGAMVGVVLVLIHMDFTWPAGTLGWLLFTLTIWAAVSGVAGVYLQKSLSVALARNMKVEAIYERVPVLVQGLLAEADRVMEGAPDVMARVYRSDIRPALARPVPRWSYVMDMTAGRTRQTELLSRIARYLDDLDRDRITALNAIVNDKLDLDVHVSVQRALRAWVAIHVPPAIVLLGLLVIHVFAVLYF